ncbi:hypothetical protein NLJ89_g12256 [Agrocybe chaxingu]|uniref:Aminoglycoside phosphotransferase domain-containing protein n=1 Tax=Agrocybe chaxingu TaxID=84603 RepID=A0A9W8JUS5_9AGAR|nr:hypothetical protein NLJ89_g12256 [Agrocybe chaxingu]
MYTCTQIYEVEALRRVRAWEPADSVVTVPEVHLFDEDAHAIVMDDAGADSVALKDFMKQGRPSLEMAEHIGAALGKFLGGMHRWGKGNEELCASVKGNAQAKAMSAWAFYGRLKDTLTGVASDVPKLSDPPLEVDEDDLKVIDALVAETTSAIMGVEDSFVMGDFWPGNLMVALDEGGNLKHIYILDWELAKTGRVHRDGFTGIGEFR